MIFDFYSIFTILSQHEKKKNVKEEKIKTISGHYNNKGKLFIHSFITNLLSNCLSEATGAMLLFLTLRKITYPKS